MNEAYFFVKKFRFPHTEATKGSILPHCLAT
jgi:hypothetical protein